MGVTRGELLALEDEKKGIEKELDDAFQVLTNNNVGMDDPLVDAEDYPRADISVYEVRHARAKIIRLRNDLKSVTERISSALAIYHQTHPMDVDGEAGSQPVKRRRLAKVDFIEEGSPAAVCGLQNGDFILEIGSVSEGNFKGLDDIASAVKLSENFYMKVVVERGADIKRINLRPKVWAGPNKGLLGCKIITPTNQ